jgi:hypothetical protein
MTITPGLGRLERVDVRTIWRREAQDFTPWLALQDNIALLADALDIELVPTNREVRVGDYRADLICEDDHERPVVIENQFGATDHSHLGQIMTYAAGLEAGTVIWIAESFRAEHRAAIAWLNKHTDDSLGFFAIEIEAWRIGTSPPAPRFSIVERPNSYVKATAGVRERGTSETKQRQQSYWQELALRLDAARNGIRPTKPQPQHWMSFYPFSDSRFTMSSIVNSTRNELRIDVNCRGPFAKSNFGDLADQRDAIERELGATLAWEEKPGQKESRICLSLPDTDWTDESDRPRQLEWFVKNLAMLRKVLATRIASIRDPEGDEMLSGDEAT